MEIEREIIMSLNEPKNFSQLYLATVNLRKTRRLGLSKSDFSKALKRLKAEEIVIDKKINGREKRYETNSIKDKGKQLLKILEEEDAKLDQIEKFAKVTEAQVKFLKNNKIQNKKRVIQKSQDLILNYINILLSRHKFFSFVVGSAWNFPSTKRELAYQQKRCVELKNRLSCASKNLDDITSGNVFLNILNEIHKEIGDHVDSARESSKYFKKLEN